MMRSLFRYLLLPLILFSSCTVSEKVATDGVFQKRKYRSGWHVSLSGGQQGALQASAETKELPAASKELPPVELSTPKVQELGSPVEKAGSEQPKEDSCDIITKRNGEEIRADVKTITTAEIRYKDCDRPEGDTMILERDSVFQIEYPNGEKDVFRSSSAPEKSKEERSGWLGPAGFIASVLSILSYFATPWVAGSYFASIGAVVGFIGLILSIAGLMDRYEEKGWATAGAIISMISVLVGLIFVLIMALSG